MKLLKYDVLQKNVRSNCITKLYGIIILIFLVFLFPGLAMSKQAIPVAENPEIEQRMLALTEDLRCLVCQNEAISESRAEFSNDIRREIREQIHANKTDDEIIEFLVERYGDFLLYNPPIKPTTLFLWFGPFILFIVGVWFLITYLRGRRVQIEEVSLSEAQLKKAESLMNENKGN
jgi:cytochrome c-type biogenesis protein CcmH